MSKPWTYLDEQELTEILRSNADPFALDAALEAWCHKQPDYHNARQFVVNVSGQIAREELYRWADGVKRQAAQGGLHD